MAVSPTLLALWLADDVTYDEDTGRPTLLGIFNRIALPVGAAEYDTPFTVFFSVTDVRTRCRCDLRLTDLSTLEVAYSRPVHLDPVGPNEVTDMTVRVNSVPLPGPGGYVRELFHETERLGSTRMTVAADDPNTADS